MSIPDEVEPIPIPIPADLEKKVGFDRAVGAFAGSQARFIGFWWMAGANDPAVTDGWITTTGPDSPFLRWDRKAGKQLLEAAAKQSDQHSPTDIPDHAVPLSAIMEDEGLNIGSELEQGNAAFLLDTQQRELYIDKRNRVSTFLKSVNESPDRGGRNKQLLDRLSDMIAESEQAADRSDTPTDRPGDSTTEHLNTDQCANQSDREADPDSDSGKESEEPEGDDE